MPFRGDNSVRAHGQVPGCFSRPLQHASLLRESGSWLRGAHTPRAAEEAQSEVTQALCLGSSPCQCGERPPGHWLLLPFPLPFL